jgi:hypothetical protein
LTETTNTEIKTRIQRRHLAHAPPWSSSTGSNGRLHRHAHYGEVPAVLEANIDGNMDAEMKDNRISFLRIIVGFLPLTFGCFLAVLFQEIDRSLPMI